MVFFFFFCTLNRIGTPSSPTENKKKKQTQNKYYYSHAYAIISVLIKHANAVLFVVLRYNNRTRLKGCQIERNLYGRISEPPPPPTARPLFT